MEIDEISNLVELSETDLMHINGGLGNFAIGAVIGAAGYGLYSLTSGNFSWGGLAGSTAAGAVSSGFSALAGASRGAQAYFSVTGAAAGGAVDSATEQYLNVIH